MNTFHLRISTPEGDVFSGDVQMLSVRGTEGELAVMAGHIPFVTSVKPGECRIFSDEDTERRAQTGKALLTVSGDSVVLLSGSFVWTDGE